MKLSLMLISEQKFCAHRYSQWDGLRNRHVSFDTSGFWNVHFRVSKRSVVVLPPGKMKTFCDSSTIFTHMMSRFDDVGVPLFSLLHLIKIQSGFVYILFPISNERRNSKGYVNSFNQTRVKISWNLGGAIDLSFFSVRDASRHPFVLFYGLPYYVTRGVAK